MINAAITDGDVVVVRQQRQAENGEVLAAMIDGETTVKTLQWEEGQVWLMPHNPTPGYPFNRSNLGPVDQLRAGRHYPRSAGEFQSWFATDATAWITWNGYAGQMASPARPAVAAGGSLVMAGSSASAAAGGPR
jgi:hypothetical protein